MSLQIHAWRAMSSFSASATNYISPVNGQLFSATEFNGSCICCAAGTFSNWQVVLPSAPGSGKSVVFTLRINGINSAAVITISDLSTVGTYTGTPVSLADGDVISIRTVPSGTPTISTPMVSWSFNGTTPNQSIYGCGNVTSVIGITRVSNLLFRASASNFANGTGEMIACPGTITKITIKLDVDTGASGSIAFVVSKNGVAQNGGGGTPDTTINFNNTGLTKSATFSLSVAAGDLLIWTATETGSADVIAPIHGVAFTSTVPDESQYGCDNSVQPSTSATNYIGFGAGSNLAPTATEANWQVNVGLTGFKLKNLYTAVNLLPGAGKNYTFNIRKGGSGTSLSAVIADAAVIGNDLTGQVNFSPQDLGGMEVVPTNTPSARVPTWSAIQFQSGGQGAGGGNSGGKKGGGGGLNVQTTGGANMLQIGNTGLDIGSAS